MRHIDSRSVYVLIVCATLAVAGCGGDNGASTSGGPLEALGLDEASAQQYTLDAVTNGSIWAGGTGARFKALSDDARAEVATEGISWARALVDSDAFGAIYEKVRNERMPTTLTFTGSVDDELEQTRKKQLAELEETRKTMLPLLPEESRADMEITLEQTVASLNDPKMIEMQRLGIEQSRANALSSYRSALESWATDYPEDRNELVGRRIQHFLDATADIDFDADLVERDGRMFFEDESYEQKSGEWKMAFRAGEDAVNAARDSATEWLDDL